jgi:hypothetical protein
MVDTKLRRPDQHFFRSLSELTNLMYAQGSPVVHVIYETLPDLLIKFEAYLLLGVEEKDVNNRLKGNVHLK